MRSPSALGDRPGSGPLIVCVAGGTRNDGTYNRIWRSMEIKLDSVVTTGICAVNKQSEPRDVNKPTKPRDVNKPAKPHNINKQSESRDVNKRDKKTRTCYYECL